MHHIVIIVVIARLTLCYSKMLHATLILYTHPYEGCKPLKYHMNLGYTGMILGRLECIGKCHCVHFNQIIDH